MKTTRSIIFFSLTIALLTTINALGQGSLTPSSAPSPSMKTLDQIESRTPISSLPYTISESGSYYVTTNLYGVAGENGITVEANNVNIDLNGFTLDGTGTSTSNGVYCDEYGRYIRIFNGTLVNWGGAGIKATRNSQIENIRSQNNNIGIATSHNCLITDCIVIGNELEGIYSGFQNSITRCTARHNLGSGIRGGQGSTINNCTSRDNGSIGIYGYNHTAITDCVARDNNGYGIYSGKGGTIANCVSALNANGIYGGTTESVGGNSGTLITGCSALDNDENGIAILSNSLVKNNVCSGNGVGIKATGDGNRIDSNNVTDNGSGIDIDNTNNLIICNSSSGNTINYEIVASNKVGTIISPPNSGAISGDSGGGLITTDPWANFAF